MSKALSASALAISEDLQKVISFSADNTTVELDNTIYVTHAEKAGLTVEGISAVKEHDRTYTAGLLHATGVQGLKAVLADHSLIETKLDVNTAGTRGEGFSSTYVGKRSGTMKGSNGAPDTDWTSFGSVRAGHKSITSGKGSDLGSAMNLVAAASEEALKDLIK